MTRLEAAVAELVEALREQVSVSSLPPAPARLLDVDEAAAMLGIGRTAAYGLMQGGRLGSLKIGRRRLVPAAAIAEYIARAASNGAAGPMT